MNKCIDLEIGRLLHTYELGILSDEERDKFEIHLLKCSFCFDELQQMSRVTEALRSDREIHLYVRENSMSAGEGRTGIKQVWEYLWPDSPLLLRPALAYAAILLLVPFAVPEVKQMLSDQPTNLSASQPAALRITDTFRDGLPSIHLEQDQALVLQVNLFSLAGDSSWTAFTGLQILDSTNKLIMTVNNLKPDSDGLVTVLLPSPTLATMRYKVTGVAPSGQGKMTIQFNVTRE